MSEVLQWTARPLTENERKAHYAEVRSLAAEEQRYRRDRWLAGWIVGGAGVLIGLLGIGAGVSRLLTWQPPQQHYVILDEESGKVLATAGPTDAPKYFNAAMIEGALANYVELRESYDYYADSLNFHQVAIMSTPDEQARYAAWHNPPAATAPGVVYGQNGWVRVSDIHPTKIGTGSGGTLEYDVSFERTDSRSPLPQLHTVQIIFEFHPELPMSPQDRLHNELGLQVMNYSLIR
jgi:type IV secretion system protein VirB8